jgi:cytoskeletal protein RodZ
VYDLVNAPLPKLPKSVKLAVKAKEDCLMKKSVILCMVAVVLISVFVGFSVKNSEVNENVETSSFSASKETTLPVTTAENDTKADTTTTAPTPTTTTKTTNKIELSETTTKRKVVSTTSKPVQTTKSITTSKQPTTKKASQCSNNNNHSMKCGNMGRWFDSKSDVKAYVDSVMKSWADKWESGEISDDEYFANCPQGYECWSCGYCGKWTGNFK